MSQLKVDSIVPSGGIPSGAAGGGIIQVVTKKITSTSTFNSTSYDNISGFNESITPQSASSKILVMFNINCGSNNNGNRILFRVSRTGEDNEYVGDASSSRSRSSTQFAVSSGEDARTIHIAYVSEPSSTSAVGYQLQARLQVGSGSNVSFGHSGANSDSSIEGRTPQSIILMEISG